MTVDAPPHAADFRRFFVALRPTRPAVESLQSLQEGIPRCRWTDPGDLHLTLRFLGPLATDSLERVMAALGRVRVRSFFLPLEGAGRFPPRGQPGVVWAGVGRGHPHLHQLRQQVDDLLLSTGIALELRAFSPHVTVGRTPESPPAAVEAWVRQHREYAGPYWPVTAVHLMASPNGPRPGSTYHELKSWPLENE